jgi:hypothetical protein
MAFSGPEVLSGFSYEGLGYIDTFILYAKYACLRPILDRPAHLIISGKYHAFAKSETKTKVLEHAVADAFMGPYDWVQTDDFAGWGLAEGPAVTTLPDGKFRL